MTTEAEKRGRLTLTSLGFQNLIRFGESSEDTQGITRAQIFAVNGHKVTSQEAKEIAQADDRSWQNDLLTRLMEQELIVRTSERPGKKGHLYRPANLNKLQTILDDHESFGFKLAKLVFPGEVTDPTVETEEEPITPEPEIETREETGGGGINDFLGEVVSILDGQRIALEDMLQNIQILVDGQASIKKRLGKIEEQERQSTSLLNAALRKLSEPATAALDPSILRAAHEDLAENIAGIIGPLVTAVGKNRDIVTETRTHIGGAIKLFKDARKDSLGNALRTLEAVTELVGDALTEETDGTGGD